MERGCRSAARAPRGWRLLAAVSSPASSIRLCRARREGPLRRRARHSRPMGRQHGRRTGRGTSIDTTELRLSGRCSYAFWPIGRPARRSGPGRCAIKGLVHPLRPGHRASLLYLVVRRMGRSWRAPSSRRRSTCSTRRSLHRRTGLGPDRRRRDARLPPRAAGARPPADGRRRARCPPLAGMIKPQFGLVVLPGGGGWRSCAGAAAHSLRPARPPRPRRRWRPTPSWRLPLRMDPITLRRPAVSEHGSFKEMSSANRARTSGACFVGYKKPDGGLVYIGAVLLLLGLAAAPAIPLLAPAGPVRRCWPSGRSSSSPSTSCRRASHERYLFPAMAVLAPLAAASTASFFGRLPRS